MKWTVFPAKHRRNLAGIVVAAGLTLGVVVAQTPPAASPVPTASPFPTPSTSTAPAPTPATAASPFLEPVPSSSSVVIEPIPGVTPSAASPTPNPGNVSIAPVGTPTPFALPSPGASPAPTADFLTPLMQSDVDLTKLPPAPSLIVNSPAPAVQTLSYEQIEAATSKDFINPNAPKLTLDQAINQALKNNPDLLNAIQQIRLTRGQVIEIRAQALPQLGVNSSYQWQASQLANPNGTGGASGTSTINIPIPGGTPLQGTVESSGRPSVTNSNSWAVTFQASQLIFDGAVIAGIKAAKFTEDASYFQLRQQVDQLVANVKIQFFLVVLNRSLIVAQEQNVALLTQQLKDQQNRYEAGTVPRFNVLQAEVALANARPPLISARNNYRIAQYQLVVLLGLDYAKTKPSAIPFNVVGQLNYKLRKIDPDESIRVAIQRSPALKAQRQNVLAQSENLNAALSGYLPTLQTQAGYTFQNVPNSSNLSDTVQGWFWGVTGNWNVFDGLATYGQSAQAKAQLYQAKNTYDNSVRQLILDVQQAISNLQEAKETIESQEASVTQATEALRLARERLDAGAGTQLDVLNAQVQLLQSQTTVLQARYNYIEALAQYDQALSLDTQYAELFNDPLTRSERRRYDRENAPTKPQPALPRAFRATDPINGLTPTPRPTPVKPKNVKATPAPTAKSTTARKPGGSPAPVRVSN